MKGIRVSGVPGRVSAPFEKKARRRPFGIPNERNAGLNIYGRERVSIPCCCIHAANLPARIRGFPLNKKRTDKKWNSFPVLSKGANQNRTDA